MVSITTSCRGIIIGRDVLPVVNYHLYPELAILGFSPSSDGEYQWFGERWLNVGPNHSQLFISIGKPTSSHGGTPYMEKAISTVGNLETAWELGTAIRPNNTSKYMAVGPGEHTS